MRQIYTLPALARLGVAAIGLAGCTSKGNVAPAEPCSTAATVRFCYGKTAVCLTEHTSLELPDGTRIRPTGNLWRAYLPQQVNGQVLRISYALAPHNTYDIPGVTVATLSCLENRVLRCGNE